MEHLTQRLRIPGLEDAEERGHPRMRGKWGRPEQPSEERAPEAANERQQETQFPEHPDFCGFLLPRYIYPSNNQSSTNPYRWLCKLQFPGSKTTLPTQMLRRPSTWTPGLLQSSLPSSHLPTTSMPALHSGHTGLFSTT